MPPLGRVRTACELAPHGFGVERAIGNGREHVDQTTFRSWDAIISKGATATASMRFWPPPATTSASSCLAGKAFQYRSEADVVARLPRRSQRSRAVLSVRWIFESGLGSTKAEHDPLIVPDKRQAGVLEELFCRQVGRLPPIEDRLGDIRREIAQYRNQARRHCQVEAL